MSACCISVVSETQKQPHHAHTFSWYLSTIKGLMKQKLIFIRHGTTEMNEILHGTVWGAPNFVDAKLWDTKLSVAGVAHAHTVRTSFIDKDGIEVDLSDVQLLIASPLKRALQTAEIIVHDKLDPSVPKIVHPLFRERLYLTSEVGKQKHIISEEHPEWNYEYVPDLTNWWYEHKNDEDVASYVEWRKPLDGVYFCPGEPNDVFRARIIELRKWIQARPEQCIVIVSHWGVLRGLTGFDFANCEVRVVDSDSLLEEPDLPDST